MQEFHSFAPIVPAQARVLLLGSMPSLRSFGQQQYYAHPQNAFWPILARIYPQYLEPNEPVLWQKGQHHLLPFRQKILLLERAGIALWDVLASCQRQSSADHSIRKPICNAVANLLAEISIDCIYCNGQKSAELFYKYIQLAPHYRVETLPSTSPAHASQSFASKLYDWQSALSEDQLGVNN